MLQTLLFKISTVTSEDPDHPVDNLIVFSKQSRGWQSERYIPFPQDITFDFNGRVHLRNIKLICHKYKVPTRIHVLASVCKK